MLVRFRHRKLVSVLAISTMALCVASWGRTAQAADPPEVRGLIATHVHFEGDSRERVAAAVLELLASCTASRTATEKDWLEASNGKCRLHFTFVKPRTVSVTGRPERVEVDEMVTTFPLSSGRVWVRSGDKYTWFAKWPGQESARLENPIQELLKEVTLDE